jgi:hypothetical protein
MFGLVALLVLTVACGGNSNASLEPGQRALVIGITAMGKYTMFQGVYKVSKGTDIRLKVYSAKADTVHVQGYEKTGTIQAGGLVQIEFIADKVGRFDVEMQRTHQKLIQLRVS